ncbi:MAG: hypothetical protein E7621_02285 [Ruminococcaceae bacterium]|nr:hypothetical protein [Oscillospiraceae bacterium]
MPVRKTKQEGLLCHNRVSKYVNRNEYALIKENLALSGDVTYEKSSVNDIILSGCSIRSASSDTKEKYFVRFSKKDGDKTYLIKECSKGSKIKQIIEPINYETVLRIVDLSTKWLCASISPLIRELGVKMTTERLRPETVMSFERESFSVGNRLQITADNDISVCEYESANDLFPKKREFIVADNDICLVQINYERIIPDDISKLIGIKAN